MRHRILFSKFVLVCCFLLPLSGNCDLVIDNFSEGNFSETIDSGRTFFARTDFGLSTSNVIGGRRDVSAALDFPPQGSAEVKVESGLYSRLNASGNPEANNMDWGERFTGETDRDSLNANLLAAGDGIYLDVVSSTSSFNASMVIRTGVDEGNLESDFVSFTVVQSLTPYQIRVGFDHPAFSDVDFTDVDYIEFQFGQANNEFVLDQVYVTSPVPEPATTFAIFAIGLARLVKRKRH